MTVYNVLQVTERNNSIPNSTLVGQNDYIGYETFKHLICCVILFV